MITLIGPLAHPAMAAALNFIGDPVTMTGHLQGGQQAGIDPQDWPMFLPGPGQIAALAGDWTPQLRRYAQIMGLMPAVIAGRDSLGAVLTPPEPASPAFAAADWPADYAAAMAIWLVDLDAAIPVKQIQNRLPRIADWVAARMRAAAEPRHPLGPDGDDRFEIISKSEPYAHFFTVEDLRLRHRVYTGGWSDALERAVFISGDATVVLPWDPVRDRVLLIDQFRMGPAARGDAEPWLYETIAGRLDGNEPPETAARREAWEEAGVRLDRMIPGPHHYSSPGATAEMLYLYLGIADLPDGSDGLGGLEAEGEDIRSHLIARSELAQMVRQGLIRNGPLLVLALWLEAEAPRLLREFAAQV